jgi:uncharacterized protein
MVEALRQMLRGMEPRLSPEPYGITVQAGPVEGAFAMVAEDEGLTVIAPLSLVPCDSAWARISLQLHSDLAAVGLTAAFAAALGTRGISANVVAGFHHDHIFVQWERRDAAMEALKALAADA